jgi:hypothetical protein
MIFNLDHEIETLHFISNGEDPIPFFAIISIGLEEIEIRKTKIHTSKCCILKAKGQLM